MEVQKHLFRIAEKSNKSQNSDVCWAGIHYSTLVIGVFFFIIFVIGQLGIKKSQFQLSKCFNENNFTLKQDQFGLAYGQDAASLNKVVYYTRPMSKSDSCTIYKNINYTQVTQQSQLMITGLYAIYKMQRKQREQLKFDNYTIILKNRSYFKDLIYGMSSLITNEIIQLADQSKLNNIIQSKQVYLKSSSVRVYYSINMQNAASFLTKITGIFQIVLSYAVSSVITSLYIYVTIIASPAVILLVLKLTPYGRTQGFFQAFKAFPWIGMHSMILRSSTTNQVRKHYINICWSLIFYFFLMYSGYYTIILQITNRFFDQPMQGGVGEVLFGYFAIVEFAALIFMRTRPFFKYFPIINTLFIFLFMLYCKFSHFGFKMIAVLTMQFFGISLFSWMVLRLQIPAQTTWNPDRQFVPNIKQPRAGLFPSFNLNWINGLPDQWTMLMPLKGPQNFTRKQMAFVNQEYQELGHYLNQH